MSTNSRWIPTGAQRDFLKASIMDYKSSQEKKSLGDFWARIFAAWFQRWPATDVAPQGLVEKVRQLPYISLWEALTVSIIRS